MFLFSGGCPSAYIKQSLFIHSTSGNGGKPVKKIPASATVLPTMKVEVQSPYNRISISHNRKGHKAFAVFLLSFLVGKCRRTIIGVKCRSPPFNLDFYVFKDSDWLEEKRMAYNNGREDRKWRIWKEAEEKVLASNINWSDPLHHVITEKWNAATARIMNVFIPRILSIPLRIFPSSFKPITVGIITSFPWDLWGGNHHKLFWGNLLIGV